MIEHPSSALCLRRARKQAADRPRASRQAGFKQVFSIQCPEDVEP
jgi:hypothetical protein